MSYVYTYITCIYALDYEAYKCNFKAQGQAQGTKELCRLVCISAHSGSETRYPRSFLKSPLCSLEIFLSF